MQYTTLDASQHTGLGAAPLTCPCSPLDVAPDYTQRTLAIASTISTAAVDKSSCTDQAIIQ